MKFKKLISAALISGALAVSGAASGAIFTVNYTDFANGAVEGRIKVTTPESTTEKDVLAGMLELDTFQNGILFSQVLAFCIQAELDLENGLYNLVDAGEYFTDASKLAVVESLFSQYLDKTGSAQDDAAFQLALWEIIYDDGVGGYDLAGGTFSATGFEGALGQAQDWLDELVAGVFGGSLSVFEAPGGDVTRESQDLITWQVPEPATLALIGAGLIGFGALRRRKAA